MTSSSITMMLDRHINNVAIMNHHGLPISAPNTQKPSSLAQHQHSDSLPNGNDTMLNATMNNGPEQDTPTSSVDTEEGNFCQSEDRDRGVEGDVEASDDDLLMKKHRNVMSEMKSVGYVE